MKRKWIWALAVLPLVVGFVFSRRLADKRPRLVLRGVNALTFTISPDGKKALVNGNHVVDLENGSQIVIDGDIASRSSFSPDGKQIYQFNSERQSPQTEESYRSLTLVDSNSGQGQGRFSFADVPNVYGVWWHNNEIIAESPSRTLVFETRNLRLVRTQKQQRKNGFGILCPDGQTICWPSAGVEPAIWQFEDLKTGKNLWNRAQSASLNPRTFSANGRTVLWPGDTKEGGIIALDTRTGKEKWRLRGPQSDVLALSPDEKFLYEARANGELWKWPL